MINVRLRLYVPKHEKDCNINLQLDVSAYNVQVHWSMHFTQNSLDYHTTILDPTLPTIQKLYLLTQQRLDLFIEYEPEYYTDLPQYDQTQRFPRRCCIESTKTAMIKKFAICVRQLRPQNMCTLAVHQWLHQLQSVWHPSVREKVMLP